MSSGSDTRASDTRASAQRVSSQEQAARRGAGGGRGPMGGMAQTSKSLHFRASALRLVGLLRPYRIRMTLVIVLSLASVALNVFAPKVLGWAVDRVFAGAIGGRLDPHLTKAQVVAGLEARGQDRMAAMVRAMDLVPGRGIDFGAVGRILLIVLALYVVASLLQAVQARILNVAVQRTMQRLRAEVDSKLQRVPLSYVDRQPRGELLSRVTNDIDNIGQSLQQTLSQLLVSVCTVIGVVIMMFTVSPLLTVIALLTIPVVLLVASQIMKRSQQHYVAQWSTTGALNGQIEEAFTAHELVKVFGRAPQVQAAFDERNQKLAQVSRRAQFLSGLMMPIMMFVGNLQYVVVCVIGGLRVASGSMTLGGVTAFIQYSRQFTQPVTQVASMVNLLQSGVASAERVFEVLDAPEQVDDGTATLPTPTAGRVTFEHVDFGYSPDGPLIHGLDLVVEPGQTVAIVGPTGAGKTTMVNLVERFYELDAGRITLDGVDIRTVPRRELRARIGMVLQDSWLFHGTIRDNLVYGNLTATPQQVQQAAEATFVDRFVRSLPAGYDTVIDDDGGGISAGERQLITIARAFLADPAVLILDEATSSVDTRTEVMLQHAMGALRTGRTSFVIAHRLSTIRDADVILVMEDGHIVEQGDHAQLLAAHGAYYRLYQSQFEGAVTDDGQHGN